jgi:hypothetical protein
MLTIFSIPKPFHGHIGIIQRNAIQSWSRLHADNEIFLCGDEAGVGETAAELKVQWLPHLPRNEYGTPFLDSAFEQVESISKYRWLCYVNSDIILLRDFIKAIKRVPFPNFLLAGQRWNLDLTEPWDFAQPDSERRLRNLVTDYGRLEYPWGIDYFVFLKNGIREKLPPFVVGRPGWDNFFIYRARKHAIPVIDITRAVTVIHQNHDYSHVPRQVGEFWEGPEADWNRRLIGSWDYVFTLLDATHLMTPQAVLPARGYKYLYRRFQTLPVFFPRLKPIFQLGRIIKNRLTGLRFDRQEAATPVKDPNSAK